MFTGLAPYQHGAHRTKGRSGAARHRSGGTKIPRENSLPYDGRHSTLAEALGQAGYTTAAYCANDGYLSRRWGLARGFQKYVAKRVPARTLTARALAWIGRQASDVPYFLFLNYMDTHREYSTVPPRPDIVGYAVEVRSTPNLLALRRAVFPGIDPAPPELVQKLVDQYDTALANLDAGLDPLLRHLERERDRSVVVITSDHGEYLGEHLWAEHPRDVYQEGIRVPLIVALPTQRSGRVDDTVVASQHLPNRILRALGKPAAAMLPKFSATPHNTPAISENYFDRARFLRNPRWGHRFQRIRRAFFKWPYKLIHSSDGKHELYDLRRDPREESNLWSKRNSRGKRMLSELERRMGAALRAPPPPPPPPPAAVELSVEDRRRLEELGYLETGS